MIEKIQKIKDKADFKNPPYYKKRKKKNNFDKIFKKSVDKIKNSWYNKYIIKERKSKGIKVKENERNGNENKLFKRDKNKV